MTVKWIHKARANNPVSGIRNGAGCPFGKSESDDPLYSFGMRDNPNTTDPWVEKARLRLAECSAESRRLSESEDASRLQKLAQRADRYQALIDNLEGRPAEPLVREPSTEVALVAIEAELMALKEQLLKTAAGLVRDRSLLKELKQRWGRAVDSHMTRLEDEGRREPMPILDWTFPVPPQTAEPFERDVHRIIRSLGL